VIYEFPSLDAPLRQGDIFIGLPRVEVSLDRLPIVDDDGTFEATWPDLAKSGAEIKAILPVRPVAAIIITQDCDTVHSQDISLCEIRSFRDVERKAKDTRTASSWVKILTQHARINLKWFYLPPDNTVGFEDKMAVDFSITIRVPRIGLEALRDFRRARLNAIADEHFRERLAEFYRRYPYDEWYSLNAEELSEYQKIHPDATPFFWQQGHAHH
jgi:hypothetical protein